MKGEEKPALELRQPQPYATMPHTADMAIEAHGRSVAEALGRLVLAYGQVVTGGSEAVPAGEAELAVPGGVALSQIVVDTLREVHKLFATEGRLPVMVRVHEVSAEAGARLLLGCGRYDPERHAEGADIKAVTYHQAILAELEPGDVVARIIVDI